MTAPDTNLVVRYLTADDAAQHAKAEAVIHREQILVLTSVLLEAEWVLRSAYEYGDDQINRVFRLLMGLPTVTAEQPAILRAALDAHSAGMDFADAIHLVSSKARSATLATFDRDLTKKAAHLKYDNVRAV